MELHIPKPAAVAGYKVTEQFGPAVNLSSRAGGEQDFHKNDWMEYMG